MEIDLSAAFGLGERIHDELRGLREDVTSARRSRRGLSPSDVQLIGTDAAGGNGVVPASGQLVLAFGPSVPQGSRLLLRSVVLGQPGATTALAGAANLFVTGSNPAQVGNLSSSQWRDTFPALPAVHFYTSRQIVVSDDVGLWAVVTGGTTGQVVTGYAYGELYGEAAYREAFEL